MDQEVMKYYLSIAKSAALAAGEVILKSLEKDHQINSKSKDLSISASVVTAVDVEAQAVIIEHLRTTFSDDIGLLSEELQDDNSRFTKPYFWCVDPLDGTLAFTQQKPGFSVSIALMNSLGDTLLGVVYDPLGKDLYSALKGGGMLKNDVPFVIPEKKSRFSVVTDVSMHKTEALTEVLENVSMNYLQKGQEVEVLQCGGACMNALYVLNNPPAVYMKPPKNQIGGGAIWDFACAALFFSELNLSFSAYNNEKLFLNNKESVYLNEQGIRFLNL